MEDLLRIYFELLGLLPMPFEVAAFIFITSLFLFWVFRLLSFLIRFVGTIGAALTELLVRLFLLPEYILMRLLRLFSIEYIPGAGMYDDVVQAAGGFVYKGFEKLKYVRKSDFPYPARWIFLFIIIVIVAWYAQSMPDLQGSVTSSYIEKFFSWYGELRPDEISTIPSPQSFNASPVPVSSDPTTNDNSVCDIVWVKQPADQLAGKSRSTVWLEIVQNKVRGSNMTSSEFYQLVVDHNPHLVTDGYEFKRGKNYSLPECQ